MQTKSKLNIQKEVKFPSRTDYVCHRGVDFACKRRGVSLYYVDMPKDKESKLGDHGVRKYDTEVGRFLSVDSKFEKYHSVNPFQYSLNNPISQLDKDGKDVLVIYRVAGTYNIADPGHISIAVTLNDPNSSTGYKIINSWSFTPQDNSILNGIELVKGGNVESRQANIISDIKDATEIVTLKTNQTFDKILSSLINGRKQENEKYNLYNNNCVTTANELIDRTSKINGIDFNLDNEEYKPSNYVEQIKANKSNIENLFNVKDD